MGIKNWLVGMGKRKREKHDRTQEVISTPTGKVRTCKSCQGKILPDHKYTKKIGYYFHRKCWKNERNAAGI